MLLVVTETRTKAGWIQRLLKIGLEILSINLKKKTGKLHSSLITVQPIQILYWRIKSNRSFLSSQNTTPTLQPTDQGVICSLKARYRNNVAQEMIEAIDSKKSFSTISLLDVMKMLVLA